VTVPGRAGASRRLVKLQVHNGDDDPAWHQSDHAPLVGTFAI
jgi:hypothetical protein